jgi:hypothetical protein
MRWGAMSGDPLPQAGGTQVMDDRKKRNRTPQTFPLERRLTSEIEKLREQVASLPHGPKRDEVLRRIRENETALHMTDWLRSGLKPPT